MWRSPYTSITFCTENGKHEVERYESHAMVKRLIATSQNNTHTNVRNIICTECCDEYAMKENNIGHEEQRIHETDI